MTGGQAYVFDPEHELVAAHEPAARRRRRASTTPRPPSSGSSSSATASSRAPRAPAGMLADWDAALRCFWRVAPVDEVARIERANEGLLGAVR